MVVRVYIKKFASYTTMHGFRRIVDSKATPKRLAWIIVFTTAWLFFIVNSSILLRSYFKYPKKTTAEIVSGGVPFPAITLCNLGSFDFYTVYKLSKGLKVFSEEDETEEEVREYIRKINSNYSGYLAFPRYPPEDYDKYSQDIFIKAMYKYYELLNKPNFNNVSYFKLLSDKLFSRINLAATMTANLLSANGVREKEFIVKCTFRNQPCQFKKIFDPYFFNCFTFTPPNVTETSSGEHLPLLEGIDNGFSVILLAGTGMLEENKVDDPNFLRLPGIYSGDNPMSGAEGVRVVIHRQGTRPFPTTEGYDVPPDRMASLGINLKRQKRLDQPHGKCREDYPFSDDSEHKRSAGPYTRKTCEKICVQHYGIRRKCQCLENTLPTWWEVVRDDLDLRPFDEAMNETEFNYQSLHDSCKTEQRSKENNGRFESICKFLQKCSGTTEFHKCFNVYSIEPPVCDNKILDDLVEKMKCAENVKNRLIANETFLSEYCECYPECDNILYDVSYSLSQWPSRGIDGETVVHEILDELNFTDRFTPEKKRKFYEEYRHNNLSKAMKDFSKINVYVSDADVFQTTEEPAITAPELISNIGGQLGVWIGVSILTLAEVLELLIAMVFHGCRKRFAKHKSNTEAELNDVICDENKL